MKKFSGYRGKKDPTFFFDKLCEQRPLLAPYLSLPDELYFALAGNQLDNLLGTEPERAPPAVQHQAMGQHIVPATHPMGGFLLQQVRHDSLKKTTTNIWYRYRIVRARF